jgi:hypothetical protein
VSPAVCAVCVNAGFIASGRVWHYEPVLYRWIERLDFGDGWARLRHGVPIEHHQVLLWAVKGEGMSVNEAVYTGTVGPDGRRRCGYGCNGVVLLRPQRK